MPKVSQEYRDARREQILGAARRCFLRSGFHQTSMQDLFVEAGLSSGAVYRYFASKEDMVLAIAEENLSDVLAMIHGLTTEGHDRGLGGALADVLNLIQKKNEATRLGPMSVLVWSEAVRSPALAQRFNATVLQMRTDLAEVVRSYQADGDLPPDASAEALASLFISIIPGFILQLALFGPDNLVDVPAAVTALWPR